MQETFIEVLLVGGKKNSLGRAQEIVDLVLQDKTRFEELYMCLFHEDAWVRMRAIDSIEKICRVHPDWIDIDRLSNDFASNTQPSIQWHLAQIYTQVDLTSTQKQLVISWLKNLLKKPAIDWIVAANAMDTLVKFTKQGDIPAHETRALLQVQQQHTSKSVVKRAGKLLDSTIINF